MERTKVAVTVATYPRGMSPRGARVRVVEPCRGCGTCRVAPDAGPVVRNQLWLDMVAHGQVRCPKGRQLRVVWDPER